jgi:L-lactate dehydrogenase (cytochrome)/(S)-mandelate dehydrogenase
VNVDRALNIGELRRLALRRIPRIVADYIEGGLDDETCLDRNISAWSKYHLLPRYLVDVTKREQSAILFGCTYSCPFGIAPTGMAAIARRDADLLLAKAAVAANIPFIISGASTASVEAVAQVAPRHAWYQLYMARDKKITEDMVRRARDAGIETLVVTVDVPVQGNRERNIRNGWVRPYRPTLSATMEALTHPQWLIEYLRYGLPYFENWVPYAEAGASPQSVAGFIATQMPSAHTWRDFEAVRRLWPGNLVIKGIVRPTDAVQAVALGTDGIIVSNHGGRQLDRSPASVDLFPAVRAAVGKEVTVMIDGGVRRGADIVAAWCLGAQFVFVGRPMLYGVAAGGLRGASRAISILRNELDLVMAQLGCATIAELGPAFLFQVGRPDVPALQVPLPAGSESSPGMSVDVR